MTLADIGNWYSEYWHVTVPISIWWLVGYTHVYNLDFVQQMHLNEYNDRQYTFFVFASGGFVWISVIVSILLETFHNFLGDSYE